MGKNGTFSDKQQKFIDAWKSGDYGTYKEAALAAGYSSVSIRQRLHELRTNPDVKKKIDEFNAGVDREVTNRLALYALKSAEVLYKALNDPNTSTKDRTIIARDLLDRAGYKAVDRVEASGDINVGLVVDDDI